MEMHLISGSDNECNSSRAVTSGRIDSSAYYLIGKWFMNDKSKKALSYFHTIMNKEKTKSQIDPDTLISLGSKTKLVSVALLKGMIEQVNARDDLEIKINVKEAISNWLKMINANSVCYASEYNQMCQLIFHHIPPDTYSNNVTIWLYCISVIMYNFVFIASEDDFQMLADEAEAYFKRVDTDDTVNKTDRNPD